MSTIVSSIPIGESVAVWFDDGESRRYTRDEIGLGSEDDVETLHILSDGSGLGWGADSKILVDDLRSAGVLVDYVGDEKTRLLKSLAQIRREAGFSQTRLGEAAGIRQSVISRIEGCEISPQINTLLKLLAPLGKTLAIMDLEDTE